MSELLPCVEIDPPGKPEGVVAWLHGLGADGHDFERVVPILQAAMEATPGVRKVPQPIVLIDETNERGVVYSLNFWVSDYPEQFPISRDVVITALRFLDQAALVPAYPKRDITISEAASRRNRS